MDPQAVIEVFRRNVTEHYFDLKGRVSRQEFWYFVLASFVVGVAAAIVDAVIRTGLLGPLVGLALLLPLTGLGARRLQDIGRNGSLVWVWTISVVVLQAFSLLTALTLLASPLGALTSLYYLATLASLVSLISLVVLVISIILIYFWVQPGTAGANTYGPDPKAAPASV
ncbi:MAG: DUF805 domain-containing protein [Rhizomicrobium sp.]|jgi:uncharacterized membrane protein YhaH (DUF805 family)